MSSNKIHIPYHVSDIGDQEIEAVVNALRAHHLAGGGEETKKVQQKMARIFDVKHALLTTSCTHAMELALMACEIGPGDEVILPSFTFSSTANAVVLQGARPVFAEIEVSTLTLDPEDIEKRITSRTKAIMPVHYAGVAADMDAIMEIAAEHNLVVIEDAAQGVGAKYRGSYLGTLGHIGCFSFHGTKNLTCGEGGAFLTNDDEIFYRAETMREKGTNRQAFLRGDVDKYTWVNKGSSYVISDILAALLGVQLDRMDDLILARRSIHEQYQVSLKPYAEHGFLTLPSIPEWCESNYHIYYVLTRTGEERNVLLSGLKLEGINATFHYVPLHSSPYGRHVLECEADLSLTDRISSTLIRLPIYPSLSQDEVEEAINVLSKLLKGSDIPHENIASEEHSV